KCCGRKTTRLELCFELFHRQWGLRRSRHELCFTRLCPACKHSLLYRSHEKQVDKHKQDRNREITQSVHDDRALPLHKCRLQRKVDFAVERDVFDGELVSSLHVETDCSCHQILVLGHLFGGTRLGCYLRLAVFTRRNLGMIVHHHCHRKM